MEPIPTKGRVIRHPKTSTECVTDGHRLTLFRLKLRRIIMPFDNKVKFKYVNFIFSVIKQNARGIISSNGNTGKGARTEFPNGIRLKTIIIGTLYFEIMERV